MTKAEAEDLIKINKKLSMVIYLMVSQNKLIFGALKNSHNLETWEGFEDAMSEMLNELKEMDKILK